MKLKSEVTGEGTADDTSPRDAFSTTHTDSSREYGMVNQKLPEETANADLEEGEVVGTLESPFFPGTEAMREEILLRAGARRIDAVRPFTPTPVLEESSFEVLQASTSVDTAGPDSDFDVISGQIGEDGRRLTAEHAELQRMEQELLEEEEQEAALADKELQVLVEALLGGLCDPDSVVRWTAVDLMRVVLKREDERGNTAIGKKVLEVAVPLARLSDDGDTRVAAINAIYHAGRSCRGWKAHNEPSELPDELHHHHSGEEHRPENHHYLHEHSHRQDDQNIEGWTLRDVLEDRLDDRDWMARRAAALAYSMLADQGDLDALHNVLPLLSDEVHGVRCAAMRAVETIAGSPFLMPNETPTELQIQILKAILDRVTEVPTPEDDPWLHPELDAESNSKESRDANKIDEGLITQDHDAELEQEKEQFKLELGVRMGLLFSLGCMDLSGWQSMEHQKWSHVQKWVHDQWRQVCDRKEEQKQKFAEKERALNNKILQAALAEMDVTLEEDEDKARQQVAALHMAALQEAAKRAATRMQARWRGIKGREVAKAEQENLFIRMSSAEMERRQEEERQRSLTHAAKLEEYMKIRGLGKATPPRPRPTSPGQEEAKHSKDVILPYPEAFSVKARRGSRSSKPGTPQTPPLEVLPSAQSPSFRLHRDTTCREEQIEHDKNEDRDDFLPDQSPSANISMAHLLPSVVGISQSMESVGEARFWDPLARKRAASPAKKASITPEEEEAKAATLFFEWEEKERKRKEQVNRSTHSCCLCRPLFHCFTCWV